MSPKSTTYSRQFWFVAFAMVGLLLGCNNQAKEQTSSPPEVTDTRLPQFKDMTASSGISFSYRNGEEARTYSFLETVGGGIGLIDYDGDGLLDIFVPGGGWFDGPAHKEIKGHPSRLYKNLGNWKFRDVTAEVGLDRPLFYSHGCAVADYDCDGWPDLLVTGWGRVALYHNVPDPRVPGGRRFVEVTEKAGLASDGLWSTSAAWADLDGDGFPELYVCHYVNWSMENNVNCPGDSERRICTPRDFNALPHKLYRNNRDGTFTDVSKEAGLYQKNVLQNSKGLGVVIVNLKNQGLPDIYVANDNTDKLLYLNRGGLKFEEVGLKAGVARDDMGMANASMGADAADYDGSGRASLWVTNFEQENHGLYRNDGDGTFSYRTGLSGIASIGKQYVGWGTGFVDVDNDGWEDLIVAHGRVRKIYRQSYLELSQQPVLFRNEGNGRFTDITTDGGPYFKALHCARGLAVGDLDNDGQPDLVVSHFYEPVVVLRNQAPDAHHWLGIELATRDHRDVAGARLTLELEGRTLTRFTKGGGSYLSAGDPRRLFGLGKNTKVGRLTVTWPSGTPRQQTWDNLLVDRYYRVLQGDNNARAASTQITPPPSAQSR